MKTKQHWMLNYLRYHDTVRPKDIIRSCGKSKCEETNRDMQRFITQENIARGEDGSLRLTDEGLLLHEMTRDGLYRDVSRNGEEGYRWTTGWMRGTSRRASASCRW